MARPAGGAEFDTTSLLPGEFSARRNLALYTVQTDVTCTHTKVIYNRQTMVRQ